MNGGRRAVLHVDMEVFYAPVEQRDNPKAPASAASKAFELVTLGSGETRTVHFQLSPGALGFWNLDMKWMVEARLCCFQLAESGSSLLTPDK
jgi:nucleotidyltransferase/DNA polymerase involved in DNA repair